MVHGRTVLTIAICDKTGYVQVLDTGTMMLNDVPLRWLAVERHYFIQGEIWQVHADTVIERIGYTTGYFAPHDACNAAADGDDGRDLRCYTDDLVSYKRIQPWSCETLLGLDRGARFRPTRAGSTEQPAAHIHLARRVCRCIGPTGL